MDMPITNKTEDFDRDHKIKPLDHFEMYDQMH